MPVSLNPPPGYFLDPTDATWEIGNEVEYISFTTNGAQPAVSEYIAYDTLTPPNPFIAVTQDGRGNVVYDGGFPKMQNNVVPTSATTFAQLTASFKYLYNALMWVANPTKVAAGNKKFLVLNDRTATPYWVKGTSIYDFKTSLDKLFQVAGFAYVAKDLSDYAGGKLNPTLAELEDYCGVFFMSTNSTTADLITDPAVTDLLTYRENGNGLIFITDHGPVIPDIANAYPLSAAGFFSTANKVVRNFGAFFSGDYNRTPVNVGFLRSTYGDHPLYNGMLDSESIAAGGSESKVVVATFPKYTQANAPAMHFEDGRYVVQVLVMNLDKSIQTLRFVYVIASGAIVTIEDSTGTEITAKDVGFSRMIQGLVAKIHGSGLGTLSGQITKNGTRIGDLAFTEADGAKVTWYAGVGDVPVSNGDVIKVEITSPFQYPAQVAVTRSEPVVSSIDPSVVVKGIRAVDATVKPSEAIAWMVNRIKADNPHLNVVRSVSLAVNLKLLRDYTANRTALPDVQAHAYGTSAALTEALGRLLPPTPCIIDALNNRVYRHTGTTWAVVAGIKAQDVFGYPRVITAKEGTASWRLNADGTITTL